MFSSTVAIAIGSNVVVGLACYIFGVWDGIAITSRRTLTALQDVRYRLFTGRGL